MDLVGVLGASELFGRFDRNALRVLAAAALPVTYERNDVVFAAGDEAADLYIVQHGRVAVSSRSSDGRESVLALMGPGQAFGEMSLCDGEGRSTDARALEPSELARLPYTAVRRLLDDQPRLLWEIVALLSRRLRATDAVLADAVFLDVPARTAKRLLELAGPEDDFVLPVTQEELAGLVGASRERVNKAIATFVRLGWLSQSGRRYRIVDRAQLELRSR